MKFSASMVALVMLLAVPAFGQGYSPSMDAALRGIQSVDSAVVQRSIDNLRTAGPVGLTALLDRYGQNPDAKLISIIDAVAGQRGAVVSRLYWYTDLNLAEAAAKEQNKPILYLRLMGKLTDEYSCANSRFFRTVLYSNRAVSEMRCDQRFRRPGSKRLCCGRCCRNSPRRWTNRSTGCLNQAGGRLQRFTRPTQRSTSKALR